MQAEINPTPSFTAEVNVRRLIDRHAWATFFGVSVGELVVAMEAVGSDADRIFLHLRQKAQSMAGMGETPHSMAFE
ncbi:MAG: hypothetical protein QM749_15505 [Aquabacterium sp.]